MSDTRLINDLEKDIKLHGDRFAQIREERKSCPDKVKTCLDKEAGFLIQLMDEKEFLIRDVKRGIL